MEKFELTPEQQEQGRKAQEAGARRVLIVPTPEQSEYLRRAQEEEEDAAMEEELAEVESPVVARLARRVRTLENALSAILAGRNEEARELLDSK